jgi:hypothetical protein
MLMVLPGSRVGEDQALRSEEWVSLTWDLVGRKEKPREDQGTPIEAVPGRGQGEALEEAREVREGREGREGSVAARGGDREMGRKGVKEEVSGM